MFTVSSSFSGFSVSDIEAAKAFYHNTLGLELSDTPAGTQLKLPSAEVFMYASPAHQPASFTILNFVVENIDEAVDELVKRGVVFEKYPQGPPQDEKNILRGRSVNMGPDIAWFKDPAGNILSVLQN